MAPARDDMSSPGGASYSSDTITVGDGTWVFSKNSFLLPNLQGVNFDTMRYNGMGNRFSTLIGYHNIVLAHGVLASLVFLLLVPLSVMIVRFYDRSPGRAIVYHSQLQVLSSLMLLTVFILGFFAVGPSRNLSNPHHGIGVAIFVLFFLQLIGGRLVRHITKSRSLRIMIHQWSGRTIALLGIAQIPLGLTLYGSPKYLFILYALWMSFLVLVYFVFSYRRANHRDYYMRGAAGSEGGRTRLTDSEYFSEHKPRHGGKRNWLGPLAAVAGLWALLRKRKPKEPEREPQRSRSPSSYQNRRREVSSSRVQSEGFYDDKYSEVSQQKGGGGIARMLSGAAAAVGAGNLAANLMKKRKNNDDEYSAVSTESPRQQRIGRSRGVDNGSDYTADYTQTSLLPPSANPANNQTIRNADVGRQTKAYSYPSHRDYDESEFSSYVSPSRRPPQDDASESGGFAKGILGGLGMNWVARKLAERQERKREDRLREEEDMRSGTSISRFTSDGYPSPSRSRSRRDSQRPPPVRRQTGYGAPYGTETDFTESSIAHPPRAGGMSVPSSVPPPPEPSRRPRSTSRHNSEHVSMPFMPADPQGILHPGAKSPFASTQGSPPQQRPSERRRKAGERAAAAAAARASSLAADEGRHSRSDMEQDYASPTSQPVSVKVKVHDDRDRNVTLRRLTDEEAMAARERRNSGASSLSGIESPSTGRGYRRESRSRVRTERRQAERRAEEEVEEDRLAPLTPPQPLFGGGRRRPKDSAYYSGAPGSSPAEGQAAPSLETHSTRSGMSPSDGDRASEAAAAADNRRQRRRMERRRGSSAARPAGVDMYH